MPKSNAVLEEENAALKRKLAEVGAMKIPTKASLKKKKTDDIYSREDQLKMDLQAAISFGPEKMAKFQDELKAAYELGDVNEQHADGKLPNLRYLIAVENEIHKHVKRGVRKTRTKDGTGTKMVKIKGGYRKGLRKELKDFAQTLLRLMGRDAKKPKWDESIPVPGLKELDING